MNTQDLSTRPDTDSAWLVISMTAILLAIRLVWAITGHPTEWFSWTLLCMIAAGAAERLVRGSRWTLLLRFLFATTSIATTVGLFLVFLSLRAA